MPSGDDSTHLQRLLNDYLNDDGRGSDAFDKLIHYATGRLRSLARKMLVRYPHVRRWEETDDVMQTAILKLHRSLSEVRPDSKRAFFGLAATQMRRTLIDMARHYYGAHGLGRNHQSATQIVNGQEPILKKPENGVTEPENLSQWTEFHEAIDRLPDDEREVLSLVWYGGLMQKEVADVLGVSERTVIRRMNQARLLLNDSLGGQSPQVDV